jgi:hypothetical protein
MKLIIIAVLLAAGIVSCTSTEKVTFTARPDPNVATSGTLGSVKATNGIVPYNDYGMPRSLDTLYQNH